MLPLIWWYLELRLTYTALDFAGLATLFWIGLILGVASLAFRRS